MTTDEKQQTTIALIAEGRAAIRNFGGAPRIDGAIPQVLGAEFWIDGSLKKGIAIHEGGEFKIILDDGLFEQAVSRTKRQPVRRPSKGWRRHVRHQKATLANLRPTPVFRTPV